MDGTKLFLVSLLLCAGVAEGYFLDTTHTSYITHDFWATDDASPAEKMQESVKDAMNPRPAMGTVKKQYEQAQSESQKLEKEEKYPFIAGLHNRLEKVFGKYSEKWWEDWKLWVGAFFWLVVWAKWLIYGYDEIYYQRALFAFGINVLILHVLQYSSSVQSGMLFISLSLAFQAIFQNCVHFKTEFSAKCIDAELKVFNADTLYLDLALGVDQICVLFVAQVAIWWFYMTSILGNFHFDHVNYAFWVISFLAMQMTMIFNRGADSVLGEVFPIHDVYSLIQSCDTVSFLEVEEDEDETNHTSEATAQRVAFTLTKANIIMRGIVGFFCNGILREIMAYTIPLMLMGFSEPMDFVVYCVGVNFICTLDDMHSRRYALKANKEQEAVADDLETEKPAATA